MKTRYNLHGLPLEISLDHPLLAQTIFTELTRFKVDRKTASARPSLRMNIRSMASSNERSQYPNSMVRLREIGRKTANREQLITQYGKSLITTICHTRRKYIESLVILDKTCYPDPAYHYLFTQPVNLWLKKSGLFFLHAGCIAENNQGILITGHPGSGKSTLSLAAVRAGFQFLGDEQPILRLRQKQVEALAFPRRIRLERKTAGLFSELRPYVRKSQSRRILFSIENIWPHCITTSCKPRLLFFPSYEIASRPKVQKISTTQAIGKLLQDDYFVWYQNNPLKKLSHNHLELFEQLVKQVRIFKLQYNDRNLFQVPSLFRNLLYE